VSNLSFLSLRVQANRQTSTASAKLILVEQDETKNIILSAEDYLLGVIGMINELVSETSLCLASL
jgi:hypothetical protein